MDDTKKESQKGSTPRKPRDLSCVICARRKVKCDRQQPCSNCSKRNVKCIYKEPAPPRRKRKVPQEDLPARLTPCEKLLHSYVASLDDVPGDSFNGGGTSNAPLSIPGRPSPIKNGASTGNVKDSKSSRPAQKTVVSSDNAPIVPQGEVGTLVRGHGDTRYLEGNVWSSLSEDIRDAADNFQDSSDESQPDTDGTYPTTGTDDGLLFMPLPTSVSLLDLHPQPMHIVQLWQTFLENVDPVCKFIHTPTLQKQILNAASNLSRVTKPLEALMFSIYLTSCVSMSNAECQSMLGQLRPTMVARFKTATMQALIRANFLKPSDLMVLQAFVFFLLGSRESTDPRTLWILTGMSSRIAQGMGLHRDGAALGLSPFDTEMRRRLWPMVIALDSSTAERSSAAHPGPRLVSDVKTPLNVNDSDLYPDMREPPREHDGPTEVLFMTIMTQVGRFLRTVKMDTQVQGFLAKIADSDLGPTWTRTFSDSAIELAEKDKAVDELGAYMEQNILRLCDPSIPLHCLTRIVAENVTLSVRLKAHHPRQYAKLGVQISPAERELLFLNSVKIIGNNNLHHAMESLRRFRWHTKHHFPWYAFIYVLSELRFRTPGKEVEHSWEQVTQTFDYHPELLSDKKKHLHAAIAMLALKAWEARETSLSQFRGVMWPQFERPRWVDVLQSRRNKKSEPGTTPLTMPQNNVMAGVNAESDLFAFEPSMINWGEWDNLIDGFDFQMPPIS